MGVGFSKVLTHKSDHEIPISSPDTGPQLTYKQPRKNLPIPRPLPPPMPTECSSQTRPVLGRPYVKIKHMYEMKEELGRGKFGVTYLCVEKATGIAYACKSIAKKRPQEDENVRREVMILQHLSGQHNIVEFKGAFEDREMVHLVMELCSGGELFDRIIAKGRHSEREAATVMRQIVRIVDVCHFMGVVHRDLKPENFLFATKDELASLKLTDFGSSVFFHKGYYSFHAYPCSLLIISFFEVFFRTLLLSRS
ncbi:unnamed protein product [Sphenostylis stenocarpa]|uniref:non-specific serine/threonine protein kinase n=1 Tax=Sphenostylis stenocarpa TaxID=92480 RepID=A0AA86T1W0_9FABA|nr:unnamed protein product [Sphenostylis stenocarpa]